MTSVYRVDFELERFQSLLFDVAEEEFAAIRDLNGGPLRNVWPTPPVCTVDAQLPQPDIWQLFSIGKSIVVTRTRSLVPAASRLGSRKSLEVLRPHLDHAAGRQLDDDGQRLTPEEADDRARQPGGAR